MQKNKLSETVHHYCRQLAKYSHKMKRAFDKDAIHDFRVKVKKLRSFLRMMRLKAREPEKLKYTKSFKKMYATTGKIRDRQLCISRLKDTDKSYREHTINQLKKEIKELADNKKDFPGKKYIGEMQTNMINHLPAIPAILVKEFIERKLATIREIMSKARYTDTELHDIRKSLKDICYIVGIYNDDLKIQIPFSFWDNEEMKKAEDVSATLGSFNDTGIALSLLSSLSIQDENWQESQSSGSIRRKFLSERRRLKKDGLKGLEGIRLYTNRLKKGNRHPGVSITNL